MSDEHVARAIEIARRSKFEMEQLIHELSRARSPRACIISGLAIGIVALSAEMIRRAESVKSRGSRGPYRPTE